jgi:hypothetical protein
VAPIDLTDIRDLKVPEFGVIEIVDAAGTEARRGELWLTASDDATMVLVRTIRDDDYGVVVVPVTLDVEVADNGALILDTSASPLVVPIAIYDRLPISLPSSALAGRVVPLRSGLDLLSLATGDPGVSRGSPLEGSADPRLEVRQYLSDRLVALDSYEAADDGDDPLPIEADSRMSTLRHEGFGWMKARPLPFYFGWGLKRCRCDCGAKFKTEVEYNDHYDTVHVLGGHND